MMIYRFYVYIITNPSRRSLYIGITNDLTSRLYEHYMNRGNTFTWAGKYHCYILIYYESFQYIDKAIAREKELKKWSRKKKEMLINSMNPEWKSLNDEFRWDPKIIQSRKNKIKRNN